MDDETQGKLASLRAALARTSEAAEIIRLRREIALTEALQRIYTRIRSPK